MAGCTGDLVEIGGNGQQDMSFAGVDLAQGTGGEMGPNNARFSPDIQSDLDAKGCTASACHGTMGDGSVMFVKAMATAQADIDTNYTNVTAETNATAADQSKLLKMPLPNSGHAGGSQFTGTSDPTYVKWLGWIQAGAPK